MALEATDGGTEGHGEQTRWRRSQRDHRHAAEAANAAMKRRRCTVVDMGAVVTNQSLNP